MSHAVLVDELANELDGWPGVSIERRSDSAAVVRYEHLELFDRRYRDLRGEDDPCSPRDPA